MEGELKFWALLFLIIAATFSTFPATNADENTEYCGSEKDYSVKVDSVDIDPNPVVRGEPATFNISATSGCSSLSISDITAVHREKYIVIHGEKLVEPILVKKAGLSGGKLTIEVFFYGLRVHAESHNLCTKTTCPIKEGSFILTHSQSLPAFTPPGSYRLRIKMTGTDSKLLTCIYVKFTIVRGSIISEIEDSAASGVLQRT
ncbi:hypothetical protein KI387_017167 [Taxus chinensis]|uniref:MD-2-related lipid-recognition domain-containing protein n=1 Tax=Taxus chinensis TaxID=29808 RepID=A0AA38GJD4_TAXCH|nr:hypothetical protein KI387_017167 [Taxus chinensis]